MVFYFFNYMYSYMYSFAVKEFDCLSSVIRLKIMISIDV